MNFFNINKIRKVFQQFPSLWLASGVLLIFAAEFRFGIGLLAWVMPVPFLLYLRKTNGILTRFAFIGAMVLGWSLAVAKICTDPIPIFIAPLFGLPIALCHSLPYLAADSIRRRIGDGFLSVLVFAGLVTIGEWTLHTFTPFASWGSAAYTQVELLSFLQFASIAGMAGIAFIMYFTAGVIEKVVINGIAPHKGLAATALALVLGVMIFGSLRLSISANTEEKTILVAGVGTELLLKPGSPLPSKKRLAEIEQNHRERTKKAAQGGAKLVSWTEGSILQTKAGEGDFLHRTKKLARSLQIELVAAYVVPLSESPLKFENKYVWIRPDGSIDHTYFKHNPVPGEPAVKGTGPMPLVKSKIGRLSGALCYDYDFPSLGREHARLNVDMAVVPSNDWRGIDPIHSPMAIVRSIEGGHSLLRSTASGLSVGSDPYGRIRARQSSFDSDEKIMFVRLPKKGFPTIYSLLGDWVIVVSILFVSLGIIYAVVREKKTFK